MHVRESNTVEAMGGVKAFLGVLAFIAVGLAATYAVFAVWLPSVSPRIGVRSYEVPVASGGTVLVEAPKPQNVTQSQDWIVIEGIYSKLLKIYVGDAYLRFEEPPRYLKLEFSVDRAAEAVCVEVYMAPRGVSDREWVPYFRLPMEPGSRHVLELWFNASGWVDHGLLDGKYEMYVEVINGIPYGCVKYGENNEGDGGACSPSLAFIGGADRYWTLHVSTECGGEYRLKLRVLEKK